MDEMRDDILNRLANRGGLYGLAALEYFSDKKKRDQLIVDCFDQCRHTQVIQFWGKTLVADIITYRLDLIRKPLNGTIALSQLNAKSR